MLGKFQFAVKEVGTEVQTMNYSNTSKMKKVRQKMKFIELEVSLRIILGINTYKSSDSADTCVSCIIDSLTYSGLEY